MRAPLDAHPDTHDDALLARLRAGDDVAFGALVDRHRPWLVRLCTRLLGYDAHAAEDAAQESLLKLHAAARRDGRPLRVRPWLTVVARNTCFDERRRRRPDLPGVLPERAAPGDDPFLADAALTAAWGRLSGRHREVLYLREVLGFSYKEIGAVMDLRLPAVETLVFRARAALRREYERSGGSAASFGLLGLRLARLGLGRRRDGAVANAAAGDAGGSGLGARLAQWLSAIPGCGEPAVAKVLSAVAGLTVAAAAVIPGLGPLASTPPAAAAGPAPAAFTVAALPAAVGPAGTVGPTNTATALKALLGNAVPADWAPHRTRTAAAPAPAGPVPGAATDGRLPITPWRDPAGAGPGDAPRLRRPVRGGAAGPTAVRSLLPERPDPVDRPEGPTHPLHALLADPSPLPLDPVPAAPSPAVGAPPLDLPSDPVPSDPVVARPVPAAPDVLGGGVASGQDAPVATVAPYDPALLRRRDG